MGAVDEVEILITGQVPGDYGDNDYQVLLAKLRLVCAEYELNLEEVEE